MAYRVGVIGAGQLARMMTPAAINLGFTLKVLAESENSSASLATTMIGDFTNSETVESFAREVDVVTFDHEHVPIAILEKLESQGVSVQPPSKALAHAQNKLLMRRALEKIGAPNPTWRAIGTASELSDFISEFGPEVIVKLPIGGYDGKGVRVISAPDQVSDWLSPDVLEKVGGELLAEEKVDFKRELAQLSARTPSGEFMSWIVVETRQRGGVCSEVISPAPDLSHSRKQEASEIARLISTSLGVTGNLAVEMFETKDGRLLVNELAMRPHNSGHFSIEGSVTSQFEQHLRAVLDLPLGSTKPLAPFAVMANLLGVSDSLDLQANLSKALKNHPHIKVHLYGKSSRAGRKLGHLTVLGEDWASALAEAEQARAALLAN